MYYTLQPLENTHLQQRILFRPVTWQEPIVWQTVVSQPPVDTREKQVMPGLKSFVSKIKSGKKDKIVEDAQLHGEQFEDVKPAASTRHKANVKTGKLRKRSQSRVDLFDGIYDEQWNGISDGDWPAPAASHFKRGFSLRPSASRVNSSDVEKAKASLAEFDREKHTIAAMRAMRISPRSARPTTR